MAYRLVSMPEDGGAAQPQPKRYKLVSPPPQEQAPNTSGKGDIQVSGGETAADTAKGLGVGIGEGAISLAGMIGDAGQLQDSVVKWGAGKLGASPEAADKYASVLGYLNPIAKFAPTSDQLTQGVKSVTGDFYQPHTAMGKGARTLGQFIPSAATGPGGLARKTAMAVLPAIGSEAAGAATEGTAAEPFARAGGALVGSFAGGAGAVKGAVNKAIEATPKASPAAVKAAYADVRNAGIQYNPDDFGAMAGQLGQKLTDAGIMQSDAPKTWARVNQILEGAAMQKSPTWDEINSMRRGVGPLTKDQGESAAASIVFGELADFEKNAGMYSTAGLSQAETVSKAGKARDLALRQIKADALAKREGRADTYVSGTESGLKNQMASLLRSNYGEQLFKNPKEREALMEVAKGGPVRNMLSTAGRSGFDFSKAGNISALVPILMGGGYGYGTGDWGTAAGILAAGSAAKVGARKIAEKDMARAIAMVLAGPQAQKGVLKAADATRRNRRIAEILAGATAGGQADD